ncbi:APC family permease [Jatrophihabitans endophyticus]|uniref:APC family permease n=1 Tax=Jatrophihabitans endophyticus TaxID=1206085 RepID=UPI0019DB2B02|nr:APC family permease [Jatrophihabitans endophyticus]
MSTEQAGHALLAKRLALPIFASDALSSVAYATQEILIVLTVGGLAYLHFAPWIAIAVVVLMATVVASYRQLVKAYPTGGGDYEVASKNIGRAAGRVVASALLVDYVMTVAVSVSSGVDNIISAVPSLGSYRVLMALLFVVLLSAVNLRGVKEAGLAFAAPTYLFATGVFVMIVTGLLRAAFGHTPVSESAQYSFHATSNLGQLALLFLILRAFSSGCTALTGVEAIANGVPAFKPPKFKNAQKTLLAMGLIAVTMFVGITILAIISKVHITEATDSCGLVGVHHCSDVAQRTVIAQVAGAVFGGFHSFGFFYIQATTALILVLAANTAFNGFPLLGAILARDSNVPRQLNNRGDRLAYSNGIVALAVVAAALIVIYQADVTRLIQLYIIGVFTSFTFGQTGMVRHWNRTIRTVRDLAERRRIVRSRAINAFGASLTGVVLVVVIITKFTKGAYLVLIAMPILYVVMRAINKHYTRVADELVSDDTGLVLPSRTHSIVLVSKVHKPTLRALAFAKATRPDTLTALTVNVDDEDTRRLQAEWARHDLPVALTVLESPFREVARPLIGYIKKLRSDRPRDIVNVFIPEYVVGRWWEQLLHNQSALRLKGRLLFVPGVMVTSVPWLLDSGVDAVARRKARLRPDGPAAPRRMSPPIPVDGAPAPPVSPVPDAGDVPITRA